MELPKIVESLSKVPGVGAIALGGSRSRNEADAHSDFDLGLYYNPDRLDLVALEETLTALDDGRRERLLNPPGAWGPWINGGAWLNVAGVPVDILLRDIATVARVVQDCMAGKISIAYQCGHPFAFVNTIYAAEIHYCQPLWQDAAAPLDNLKALLHSEGEYPPQMRQAVVAKFLWEAEFSLACGRKAAYQGDLNYAMGSMFRAVCAWLEVLYALNDLYLMNEKGALPRISRFIRQPADLEARVNAAYQRFAAGRPEEAYRMLDDLHGEVAALGQGIAPALPKIR